MGKASRTKQDPDRRARIAAQRAAEKRRQQRNRIYIAGGSIFAVIIVAVVVVLVGVNHKAGPTKTSTLTGAALTSVVNKTTTVPASVLDQVGTGSGDVNGGSSPLIPLKGGAILKSGGKPEMLYMGALYCPYCAAERWSMIVALSRFGTFTGLNTTYSAAHDGAGNAEPNPNTPTWSFVGSKFTSKYLTFVPVEMYSNVPDTSTGDYETLQTPTAAETAAINKWDNAPYVPSQDAGAFPFVDFGDQYMISGASYSSTEFPSLTWAQIASDIQNPSTEEAKGVDGTANYITAAICKMTNNQPSTACDSTIQGIEKGL
jgi:hypothetical protein